MFSTAMKIDLRHDVPTIRPTIYLRCGWFLSPCHGQMRFLDRIAESSSVNFSSVTKPEFTSSLNRIS
jgi:hypothetical protein